MTVTATANEVLGCLVVGAGWCWTHVKAANLLPPERTKHLLHVIAEKCSRGWIAATEKFLSRCGDLYFAWRKIKVRKRMGRKGFGFLLCIFHLAWGWRFIVFSGPELRRTGVMVTAREGDWTRELMHTHTHWHSVSLLFRCCRHFFYSLWKGGMRGCVSRRKEKRTRRDNNCNNRGVNRCREEGEERESTLGVGEKGGGALRGLRLWAEMKLHHVVRRCLCSRCFFCFWMQKNKHESVSKRALPPSTNQKRLFRNTMFLFFFYCRSKYRFP